MDKIIEQMERYHSEDKREKQAAMEEIYNENCALIGFCIDKYYKSYKKQYYEDLFSAGKIGFFKALEKYDPHISKLSTYLPIYIHGEMYRFIAENIFNMSSYSAHKLLKINNVIEKYTVENGDMPSADMISELTNISTKSIQNILMRQEFHNYCYLDDIESFDELMDSPALSAEEICINKCMNEKLFAALNELDRDEYDMITKVYGLFGPAIISRNELAKQTGESVVKVRSIVNSAISKLKIALGEKKSPIKKYTVHPVVRKSPALSSLNRIKNNGVKDTLPPLTLIPVYESEMAEPKISQEIPYELSI